MKTSITFLLLCATLFAQAKTRNHINPIFGDRSYILKFGETPNEFTPDQIRISTHLEYAEYVLRSKDISGMTVEQIEKRTHLLDLLHEYRTRGVFPCNSDETDERRPCFIDENGNICAVGYLLEQTAGRQAAELIASRHKYEAILEMKDQLIYDWVATTGLTLEELAIIQPSYSEYVNQFFVGTSYRIADKFYPTISYGITEAKWLMKGGDVLHNGHYITFDWLYHRNFSAGIRFVHLLPVYAWEKITPIIAFKPEGFHYGYSWGMNVNPEAGIIIGDGAWSCRLSYAYAVPVIARRKYDAGRHDLTFGVAFVPARKKNTEQGSKF